MLEVLGALLGSSMDTLPITAGWETMGIVSVLSLLAVPYKASRPQSNTMHAIVHSGNVVLE